MNAPMHKEIPEKPLNDAQAPAHACGHWDGDIGQGETIPLMTMRERGFRQVSS